MVSNVSALGRSGIYEWLLVRISAIIIFLYIIYLFSFILFIDIITYDVWRNFFNTSITQIFTILTLFFVLVHTWIGMWQILTDYIKSLPLRLILQLITIIMLMVYLLYGTILVWRA